jgi:hypothetical protein
MPLPNGFFFPEIAVPQSLLQGCAIFFAKMTLLQNSRNSLIIPSLIIAIRRGKAGPINESGKDDEKP